LPAERHVAHQTQAAVALVQPIRLRQPRIGTRKLHSLLGAHFAQAQMKVGRDRLFHIADLRQAAKMVAQSVRIYKQERLQTVIGFLRIDENC
jgi:hypothetical protein